MHSLLSILLFISSLQVSTSPEDMYAIYDRDGKYRAMEEQVDRMNQRLQEAEKERGEKKTHILVISLLVGIVPVVAIGKQVLSGKTWKENPSGTAMALLIAVAGGFLLFAFNYGVFYLKMLDYGLYKGLFSLALVLALFIGGIWLLRKKKK